MSIIANLAFAGARFTNSGIQPDEISGQVLTMMAVVMLALAPFLKWISGLAPGRPSCQRRWRIAFSNAFRIGASVSNAFGLLLAVGGAFMFLKGIIVAGWLLLLAVTVVLAPAVAGLFVYGSIWVLLYMEEAEFFAMKYVARPAWMNRLVVDALTQTKAPDSSSR